jgi:hypothetical protein
MSNRNDTRATTLERLDTERKQAHAERKRAERAFKDAAARLPEFVQMTEAQERYERAALAFNRAMYG